MGLTQYGKIAVSQIEDLDLDASVETLHTATLVVYGFEFDNTENSSDVFVKIYEDNSPTVGTTLPTLIFRVKAGKKRKVDLDTSGLGHSLGAGGTAVKIACVTTGGTGGATAPANNVKCSLATD